MGADRDFLSDWRKFLKKQVADGLSMGGRTAFDKARGDVHTFVTKGSQIVHLSLPGVCYYNGVRNEVSKINFLPLSLFLKHREPCSAGLPELFIRV